MTAKSPIPPRIAKQMEQLQADWKNSLSLIEGLKTDLAAAQVTIIELKASLEKEQKATAQEKTYKDMYSKSSEAYKAELEQLHGLIDALPGALTRKTECEDYPYKRDNTAMTRLASWMAIR
jgi:chromosome segregation ATPase